MLTRVVLFTFFVTLFLSAPIFSASTNIVLFKQAEIGVSSLGHNEYQALLQANNGKSIQQLEEWVRSRGLRIPRGISDLWLVRGATIELDPQQALALSQEPWVAGVYLDRTRKYVHPVSDLKILWSVEAPPEMPWGITRMGVPAIRKEFPELNGSGIRVAILDTGIQSRHPEFFETNPQGGAIAFKDFVSKIALPYDDHGHGTHVAATIAGTVVGIAPKATLMAGKIFTAGGFGNDSEILEGMQWVFDPDGDPETEDYAHIVSNSWGAELASHATHSIEAFAPLRLAVQAWVNGGIIPVFAAGNSGSDPNGVPGGFPESLAVAAIDSTDNVAKFSSSGPNIWRMDNFVLSLFKPDLAAPGVDITSAFPGNQYATWSGTSMATPHVSGALALLLQANSKLKYAEVKDLLIRSAEPKMDFHYGYGILNAYELIKKVMGKKS